MKMDFGVCCLSVIPVRADASDKSEMVSQLLFGETFKIHSFIKGWAQIITDHDNYEGWIDIKQFIPLNTEEYTLIQSYPKFYTTDKVQEIQPKDSPAITILPGSIIYAADASEFLLGQKAFSFNGNSINSNNSSSIDTMVKNAHLFLNSPYLWGGRTPFGIDCSGFVQLAGRLSGISLPRDTGQQVDQGELINLISEAKPGDLAFFDNAEGRIIHVGIILDKAQIIHASGQVRIDTIDHQGIFREDTKKYSHQLRVIKRIMH